MGTYIDIFGHPTWVHIDDGDQPPLLLLHGGLSGSDSSWGKLPGKLSERNRLVMFDRRGHGRTSDTSEPFHYAAMADETAAVIEALDLAPVNVVGYSDGGNLLLHLARTRPELLNAMVLLSANYHHDALLPEAIEALDHFVGAEDAAAQAYGQVSPDGPQHWPVVVTKGIQMGVREEPTFTVSEISEIRTRTLVLASDDDQFAVSHTVSMYEALPNAQLAIVPNTSHLLVFEKPDLVARLITEFFDYPERADTLLPSLRRPPTRS